MRGRSIRPRVSPSRPCSRHSGSESHPMTPNKALETTPIVHRSCPLRSLGVRESLARWSASVSYLFGSHLRAFCFGPSPNMSIIEQFAQGTAQSLRFRYLQFRHVLSCADSEPRGRANSRWRFSFRSALVMSLLPWISAAVAHPERSESRCGRTHSMAFGASRCVDACRYHMARSSIWISPSGSGRPTSHQALEWTAG